MKPALLPHAAIAVFTVASLLAPPTAPTARAEAAKPVATIIEVQGPVTWHAGGETAFRDAMGGEALYAGAIVRTGVKGNAKLKWRNGGDFRLLPLSEIVIPEDEGVLLKAGKVWAQFTEKLLAPFYFKSPSATAVVRGTILGVELKPEGETSVEVLEGRVEVISAKGGPSRMLEPGQSLTVSPFGQLGPIMPVDPGMRMFERQHTPLTPEQRPGGPGGPDRPRPQGAVDWLRDNRASVRLETMRQEERTRREFRMGQPRMRPEGEHPDGQHPPMEGPQPPMEGPQPGEARPGLDRPGDGRPRRPMSRLNARTSGTHAVTPERAFPAGRPMRPDRMMPPPACDPATMPLGPGGVAPTCPPQTPPPPPPPPGGTL